MEQKNLFKQIFIVAAIILTLLPLIVTFSAAFTSLFNRMGWYVYIQNYLVPFEARLVAVAIRVVGIPAMVTGKTEYALIMEKNGNFLPVSLEWNCLGWQSIILLTITFLTGLRGNYSFQSKLETVVLGIVGTFLINIFRMAFVISLAFYWSSLGALIVHDYFASLVALIWMIFFWWFTYSYLLEPRKEVQTING